MSRAKVVAVGLLALALAAAAACSPATGEPAAYQVSVDLFSGRENPETALSASVAERIYGELSGRATDFQDAADPATPLGFRGFVVTPRTGAHPVLRVTRDAVYTIRDGVHRKLADPAGAYYRTILDDIRSRLPQDVIDALA
ncbi:hypothetical protein [Catellatospora sp. NPDC049133]|jgi:hypothetical protein|uniref:hypothetical protein n=1 Tax=Catellatospora sp. NPDC049133 TaxID=3155499 RepID=UPI0033ED5D58